MVLFYRAKLQILQKGISWKNSLSISVSLFDEIRKLIGGAYDQIEDQIFLQECNREAIVLDIIFVYEDV